MKHESLLAGIDYQPHADIELLPDGLSLMSSADAQRDAIYRTYKGALQLNTAGASNEEVDLQVNKLGEMPGIEIIEQYSFRDNFYYRCAEYVFGEVYHEDWAQQFITHNEPEFWSNSVSYLMSRGYKPVEQPRRGDVIAYGGAYDDGRVWFGHFGIYAGTNKVISKYGAGPIALHDLSLISRGNGRYEGHWGDYAWFFAKEVTDLPAL